MKPVDKGARLRVCIVTDAYLPGIGGVENHTVNLARELRRQGHEVLVVTHEVPAGFTPVPGQVDSPVPVRRLPGRVLVYRDHDVAVDPRMLFGFSRLLDARHFDILHGQSEASALAFGALLLARRRGIPTIITRHSMLRAKPAFARPFVTPLVRLLLRSGSALICVSRACAEESRDFPGPVRVIPNAVDTVEFRPMPDERRRIRSELGFRDEDVVVGMIGRLHRTKGVPLLLSSFERLADIGKHVRLLLAGPGPMREAIARSPSFADSRIRLLDTIPYNRVARLLNALDVFALPSRGEGFGISVLEAMACGVPAVAVGRWGILDLVVDGETGLLARTAAEFSQKLVRLATEPELRLRMGEASRKRACARFTWERVGEETVRFYREIMERASA